MGKSTSQKGSEAVEKPKSYPLSGGQALQVLRMLANRSAEFAKEIAEISASIFCDVSVEDVASSVYDALNALSVEDCWDASGRQRGGGYRDEFDVADEMIREAFSPFTHQIDSFHDTDEHVSELAYIQGMLLGLYQYKMDSTNDFSEQYAEDYPESLENDVLDVWMKRHPDDTSGLDMLYKFLEEHCPDWSVEPDTVL
ncbi:MAG TPA: hypothetical protein VJ869_12285 [Sphaerochaeta sp.]|nr:hypothetical protein [Sphaerochaeta sp.]